MPLPEKAYLAALNSINGIGYKTVRVLVKLFGSAEAVLKAEEKELKAKGCSDAVIAKLMGGRKTADAEKLYDKVLSQGINLITVFEPEYPFLLKQTPNPPTVLYVKGKLPSVLVNVAIVGTRTATVYGANAARSLASQLAERNVCIVSGMARGIDTNAHKGALDVQGPTVAVFGCGVDVIYPPENRALAAQIAEEGALVSEFPLGMAPERGNFPARNRIISGLSHGVVVVEAPKRSGALITADFALDQGREVFAIPGAISSRSSQGCNQLIKEGAKLVQGVGDILEELQGGASCGVEVSGAGTVEGVANGVAAASCAGVSSSQVENGDKDSDDKIKRQILHFLSGDYVFLDELCTHCGFSPSEMNILITKLEMEGLVCKSGSRIFALNK